MANLLDAFVRRLRWIILVPLVGVAAGLGLALLLPNSYTAQSTVQFGVAPVALAAAGLPVGTTQPDEQQANTTIKLAKLAIVRERAAARLGPGYSAESLKKIVKFDLEPQTSLIKIAAKDRDPDEAARIANAVADSFVVLRRQVYDQQLATAITRLAGDYQRLRESGERGARLKTVATGLTSLRLLRATQTGDVVTSERATAPDKPSAPKPLRYAIIGGFIGLLLGLALAVVLEQLDRRLRDGAHVAQLSRLPLLAEIPDAKELARPSFMLAGLPLGVRDGFQRLWSLLQLSGRGERPQASVLVAAPGLGSGATTVSCGLAASAAESGSKVLLIEADLRDPALSDRLELPPSAGLSSLLSDGAATTLQRALGFAGVDGTLDVLTAGERSENPSAILGDHAMRELLTEAAKVYDLVVIDAPSPSVVPDALALIRQVDSVVMAVRLGHDSDVAVRESAAELALAGADVSGVVVLGGRKRTSPYDKK